MLQRQIYVMTDLWVVAHQLEKLDRESQRIAVMQANPLDAVDFGKLLHQLNDMRLPVDVVAVICKVLSNEYQLFNAFLRKIFGLFHEVFHWH